jgi:hypothetical protein
MKIRTLLITAASVIALSGAAMADDHLANAQDHGLSGNPNSQGAANSDNRPGQSDNSGTPAPGQGSPFSGEDTHTPSSATVEEKHADKIKERCLDPANPKCTLP